MSSLFLILYFFGSDKKKEGEMIARKKEGDSLNLLLEWNDRMGKIGRFPVANTAELEMSTLTVSNGYQEYSVLRDECVSSFSQSWFQQETLTEISPMLSLLSQFHFNSLSPNFALSTVTVIQKQNKPFSFFHPHFFKKEHCGRF